MFPQNFESVQIEIRGVAGFGDYSKIIASIRIKCCVLFLDDKSFFFSITTYFMGEKWTIF